MSNETPNQNPEKTGSVLSLKKLVFYSVLGMATIATGWVLAANDPRQVQASYVELSGHQFDAEVADTEAERTQGLSNRNELPANAWLLFVFDEDAPHCFWMKDMKFSIDIIWMDQDKKVVKIKENVKPETYPESFCPEQPALYVLEVNAGVARHRVDDRLDAVLAADRRDGLDRVEHAGRRLVVHDRELAVAPVA